MKIVVQYDIILIQEIVDTTERAINDLLNAVNDYIEDKCKGDARQPYELLLSPRVGRNNQKEQYAFLFRFERKYLENFNEKLHIFRCNKVKVSDSVIYPDPGDIFIREPFIAKFSTRALSIIQHFAIIAIHTQPKVIFLYVK